MSIRGARWQKRQRCVPQWLPQPVLLLLLLVSTTGATAPPPGAAAAAAALAAGGFPCCFVHGRYDLVAGVKFAARQAARLSAPLVVLEAAHFVPREQALEVRSLPGGTPHAARLPVCALWAAGLPRPCLGPASAAGLCPVPGAVCSMRPTPKPTPKRAEQLLACRLAAAVALDVRGMRWQRHSPTTCCLPTAVRPFAGGRCATRCSRCGASGAAA